MKQHIVIGATNEADPKNWQLYAKTTSGKEVPLKKVGKATADYSLISHRMNTFAGRILTQMDASLSDSVQRKAVKDIIRQMFAEEFSFYGDLLERHLIEDSLKGIEEMSDSEFAEWSRENLTETNLEDTIAPGK